VCLCGAAMASSPYFFVNATTIRDERKHIMFTRILDELATLKKINAAVSELNVLSDRELDDLGIARSQIREIAKQSAQAH
jgi:uncharacterized protein YjiS (DUF1127 family)